MTPNKINKETDDVIVWSDINPNKNGSFESFLAYLTIECRKKKIKIRYIFGKNISESVKDAFKKADVNYYALEQNQLTSAKTLFKILKEGRPRLVHFNFIGAGSSLIFACRIVFRGKIIMMDHSSRPINFDKESRSPLESFRKLKRYVFAKMVDRFIAVSDFVAQRLIVENNIAKRKITVIHNGIDLERFSPISELKKSELQKNILKITDRKFVISCVAQLVPEKGISVLLEAAKIIVEKHKNTLFLVVGTGPQAHLLKNIAKNLRLESNINFMGMRDNIEEILRLSDIFVLPSIWGEAFGLASIEASASGIPVITTRIGANPETIIDGKTGLVVPPNNSVELASAIETLIVDEEKRKNFGIAGRKRAMECFDIKKMVSKTTELYQEMLKI